MTATRRTRPTRLGMLAALVAALAVMLAPAGAGAQDPPKSENANCATGRTPPSSWPSPPLVGGTRHEQRVNDSPARPRQQLGAGSWELGATVVQRHAIPSVRFFLVAALRSRRWQPPGASSVPRQGYLCSALPGLSPDAHARIVAEPWV